MILKNGIERLYKQIQAKISCSETTNLVSGIPERDVVPWPQSLWSMSTELGTVVIHVVQPIRIHWTSASGVNRTSLITGKVVKRYDWWATIYISDGLGFDKGDGLAYDVLGDGRKTPKPLLGTPTLYNTNILPPPSYFPDREIIRAVWILHGYGECGYGKCSCEN